jgi:NAD(P)-dependent dehydrogenase (short-subunit alcohol dehydrogenase family)
MSDHTGRTVVVTGATGALGAGLAAAFTSTGANLVGVDRAMPDARATVDGVRYETADLTDDGQVGALFDAIGAPWAVVNTVGGFAARTPLAALDPGELTRQLSLNLITAAVVTKHALLFAGHRTVAEGVCRAGFGKRRARPSSLSLVRLVSRLACAGVAAICPLQKIVKGIRFTADPAGQVAGPCQVGWSPG